MIDVYKRQDEPLALEPVGEYVKEPLLPLDEYISLALRHRQEPALLEDNLVNAEIELNKARSGLLPHVSFRGSLSDDGSWSIGIDLSKVLPDVYKRQLANRPEIVETRDALEIAELEVEFSDNDYTPELAKRLYRNTLEKIRLQSDQVKQGVQIEARRLYLAVQNAERGMEVAQAVAVQAEENHKIMKLRYEYGMEIANTLLGAQVNLTEAKLEMCIRDST